MTTLTMPTLNPTQRQRSLLDACHCARICEEFRGRDTVVLDLTEVTPIVDFFVITTGNNVRQMHAIADEVRVQMRARGNSFNPLEGAVNSPWVLQDYGDIVLHVFTGEARELYDLEKLWSDGKLIDWRAELGLPAAPKTEAL